MKRIIFMDLNIVEGTENQVAPRPDPELALNVNNALERLEPVMRDILKMRYYDGATTIEIATAFERQEKEIINLIYEARRRMRIYLADFVKRRWGIDSGNICRICTHPEREIIENILKNKSLDESWKTVTDRIYKAVGERFHPPQVLKAHMKHTNHKKDENSERG